MNTQENTDWLWWTMALVDSSVGAGMFMYGVRQKAWLPLAAGIALNAIFFVDMNGISVLAITGLIGVAYMLLRKYA